MGPVSMRLLQREFLRSLSWCLSEATAMNGDDYLEFQVAAVQHLAQYLSGQLIPQYNMSSDSNRVPFVLARASLSNSSPEITLLSERTLSSVCILVAFATFKEACRKIAISRAAYLILGFGAKCGSFRKSSSSDLLFYQQCFRKRKLMKFFGIQRITYSSTVLSLILLNCGILIS